ncbi:hypothetical protein COV16_04915 [Candidatus Woesearchaeota archaeon CG10_big_fil_rev_8_21_14_0_10_34_8]|nr:MAG: hypothetical protein COV16_04915 [Candidatus Woesearchaeota archaeon CG10_big_fil_rev_8_21_14_0_10_34_8]
MGIISMFFKKRNAFATFEQKARRLFAFEKLMEKELEADHFKQFKGHLRALMRVIGLPLKQNPRSLIRLLEAQKVITAKETDVTKRRDLVKYESQIEIELHGIFRALEQAVTHCDNAIANINNPTVVAEEKQNLLGIMAYLERFTLKMREDADKQRHLYEEESVKIENVKLPTALRVEGTLSEGLRLSTVQTVVRQLGGWFEPGGSHAYKIVFPGRRPVPIGPGIAEGGKINTLAKAIGVSQSDLTVWLKKGKVPKELQHAA